MTSEQYSQRAASCRAQANELARQVLALKHWADLAREDGRNADEKEHAAKARDLELEIRAFGEEAEILEICARGNRAELLVKAGELETLAKAFRKEIPRCKRQKKTHCVEFYLGRSEIYAARAKELVQLSRASSAA